MTTPRHRVIDGDDEIDDLYLKIDSGVLQMLALQSPVALDLRLISAILHRSPPGAYRGPGRQRCEALPRHEMLAAVSRCASRSKRWAHVVTMVRTSMEAFGRDLDLALKVPVMDDPVDRLNRTTHLEALKLADDPSQLDWGLHMNMAARALERVGDNAVDIAEQVGFLLTGEFREFTDASHPVVME